MFCLGCPVFNAGMALLAATTKSVASQIGTESILHQAGIGAKVLNSKNGRTGYQSHHVERKKLDERHNWHIFFLQGCVRYDIYSSVQLFLGAQCNSW